MMLWGCLLNRMMSLNSDHSSPPRSFGRSVSPRQANSLPPVQEPNSGRGRSGTCTGWRRSKYNTTIKSESIELWLSQPASNKTAAFARLWLWLWTIPDMALGSATTAGVRMAIRWGKRSRTFQTDKWLGHLGVTGVTGSLWLR